MLQNWCLNLRGMSHLGNKEQNIGWRTWITILIKYKIRIQKNSFILFPKGHFKIWSDLFTSKTFKINFIHTKKRMNWWQLQIKLNLRWLNFKELNKSIFINIVKKMIMLATRKTKSSLILYIWFQHFILKIIIISQKLPY